MLRHARTVALNLAAGGKSTAAAARQRLQNQPGGQRTSMTSGRISEAGKKGPQQPLAKAISGVPTIAEEGASHHIRELALKMGPPDHHNTGTLQATSSNAAQLQLATATSVPAAPPAVSRPATSHQRVESQSLAVAQNVMISHKYVC